LAVNVALTLLSLSIGLWLGGRGRSLAADGAIKPGDAVTLPALPNLGPGAATNGVALKSCSPVSVKTAELVRRDGNIVLKVTGEAPYAGMTLEVRPVVYVMQPDYWLMSLVGCLPHGTVAAAVTTPFSAVIDVHGSVGRKGVDLSSDPKAKQLRLDLPT
jgi:hypothetical protein